MGEWANLMGYDINKIKNLIKNQPTTFDVEKLPLSQARDEGLAENYPYRLWNPYNFDVKNN